MLLSAWCKLFRLLPHREQIEAGVISLQCLRGKKIVGVLDGMTISTNNLDVQKLRKSCKENEVEVWLPDGSGHGPALGCLSSPFIHQLSPMHPPLSSCSKAFTTLASTHIDLWPMKQYAVNNGRSSRFCQIPKVKKGTCPQ